VSRKYFCDKCGREMSGSEMVQLLDLDLCKDCCRETVIDRPDGQFNGSQKKPLNDLGV
jgi:hypothetical protein